MRINDPQRQRWITAMDNLQDRRQLGTIGQSREAQSIRDYESHLRRVSIGESVLDVGCGDMGIRAILRSGPFRVMGHAGIGPKYVGIDAFPINNEAIKMEAEEMDFPDQYFDTVLCFAVLDGVRDAELALRQMARVAAQNIVFLTGLNIEPDQYHTYKITLKLLDDNLPGFIRVKTEYLAPQVALIEFIKRPA